MYNTNAQSLAAAFPGVEGGLDAAVDVPSASVDMPSGSVDVPSVDLSGKAPDMPSVGGEISGDLPSVDAKLTGPDVDVEGDSGVSLGAGLAAGVTAAVGAAAVGLGLSGKADKPEGEVRVCLNFFFVGYRHSGRLKTPSEVPPRFGNKLVGGSVGRGLQW